MSRKSFQRLSQDTRRRALLEATLESVGKYGLNGATVRRIADEAGVSAGLIRHYFETKDDMVRDAYAYLVGQLTSAAAEAADAGGAAPAEALSNFIIANVTPPILSARNVSLWATFIGRVREEPGYSDIHHDGYSEFLDILKAQISAVLSDNGQDHTPERCRALAIAMNGLTDGLWLEGSIGHDVLNIDDLPQIALSSAEGLLRLPTGALSRHLPPPDQD